MTDAGDDDHPAALWRRVAAGLGEDYADRYADRFEALAARGQDPHGEADFLQSVLRPGARVLDAGCGTGRVGLRLHELGFEVTGVDADEPMVEVATRRAPGPRWLVGDLATLDLGETFEAVVLAGNVVPFLTIGRLGPALQRLAAHLARPGVVVCGYGLDEQHVPMGGRLVPLADYDAACAEAGLELWRRFADWDGHELRADSGYAVSLHRRVDDPAWHDLDQSGTPA